jgi:hypothetical protein
LATISFSLSCVMYCARGLAVFCSSAVAFCSFCISSANAFCIAARVDIEARHAEKQ